MAIKFFRYTKICTIQTIQSDKILNAIKIQISKKYNESGDEITYQPSSPICLWCVILDKNIANGKTFQICFTISNFFMYFIGKK